MSLQLYRENGTYRRQQRSNSEWTKKNTPRSQSNIPLLLVSLDVLCLTVVASALFCLCCKYWAFCLQTYRKTHTWSTPPALKCKPHWIIAKDKNLPACPFQASPSKPLPTFYSVRQTLQIICKPIQFICFFLPLDLKCFITNYTVFQSFSHLVPAVLHLCWPCTPYRTPDTLLCFSSWAWWQKNNNNNWAHH